MATSQDTVDFILDKLNSSIFSTRKMFGEYALYADGKVVGLICDDILYVKITPESKMLDESCEKDKPYPGAKYYYVIEEDMLSAEESLPNILFEMSKNLPSKKKKNKKI